MCYDYYDADSNPQVGVAAYKWYRYDEETSLWEPTAETGPTHSFDADNDTNRFKCSVTVSDGPNPEDWGTDTNSPLAIIGGPCFLFESNVTVSGTGLPVTDYVCGETYSVDFEVSAEAGGRQKPVEIMLSLDRSGSMSWIGQDDVDDQTMTSVFFDSSEGHPYAGTSNYVYKMNLDQESGDVSESGQQRLIDHAYGLYVDDTYVYVADGDAGIRVINKAAMAIVETIGEESDPRELTTARSVFVDDDYIYAAAAGTTVADPEYDVEMIDSRTDYERIGYSASENWTVQSFIPNASQIDGVRLGLWRSNNPDNLTVHLRENIYGPDLASVEVSASTISNETSWWKSSIYRWENIDFSETVDIDPTGKTYYIVLTTTSQSSNNYYQWGSRRPWWGNPYANGTIWRCTSPSGSGNCTAWEGAANGNRYEDARFRTYTRPDTILAGGLVIIDKSDWSVKSNLYDTGDGLIDEPNSVFVSGNYAYLANGSGGDGTQGLWIVDITDKENPEKKSFVPTTNAKTVAVSGNYAYVADEDGGLRVIDVSNKSAPVIVKTLYGGEVETVLDVGIYDTNVYVIGRESGNDKLHVIDAIDPPNASEIITFDSPYDFYKMFVSDDYIYLAMSYGLITLDRIFGPKINFAKSSASEFVNFEDWKDPEDKLGVSSYGNGASSLDFELSDATIANKALISTTINGIVAWGGTPIDDGLKEAIDELLGDNGRDDAIHFMVLLADGQSDYRTQGAIDTQVAIAKDEEIYIFTIGFGGDVDETQLENIATGAYCPDEATGDCGSYHHISDPGALSDVYQLIAVRIAELSGRMPDGLTTNVELNFEQQFGNGITVENISESGEWNSDTNTLDFEALDIRFGWEGSFDTTIACNYVGCGEDFVAGNMASFPPTDTQIYYELEGIEQDPIYWPNKFEVETVLYYNDLVIEFVEGLFYSTSDTRIKYEVLNEGYQSVDLGEINPTVNFYNEETSETACNGTSIGTESFPDILDATYGASSGINTSVEGETNLDGSGYICLWVNEPPQTNVIECEENNQVLINCDIPETCIYVMDYWTWEK